MEHEHNIIFCSSKFQIKFYNISSFIENIYGLHSEIVVYRILARLLS